MKKLLLFTYAIFFISVLHATTDTIKVSDNKFEPATANVTVGDTILWIWVEGFHNTKSLDIPTGAATWDHNLFSSADNFKYKVTKVGTYNYWCAIHQNLMTATLNVSEILPVTLTALNVMAAGNTANIQWRTVNEVNIASYTIKRSSDGTNFTNIGQVKATNKSSSNIYNFTDKTIPATDKYVYYYLDILDKDGSHTLSAIRSFKNIYAKSGLLHYVSPNPVIGTNHLMLQFYADKPGKMLVQLYDASGTLVKQAQLDAGEGINNGHFHLGALAAGTYVLRCTLDGENETRQIIVQ